MEFLETKDNPPVIRGPIVRSPRRSHALSISLERPLTLVFAPSGYGKTTLCASFCADLPVGKYKTVWLNLDESDSNLEAFVFDLVNAMSRAVPALGLLEQLGGRIEDLQSREAILEFLVSFANILGKSKRHLYVVLDNYDFAPDSADLFIRFLARSASASISMVLITNSPAKPDLADLRFSGDLVEIGVSDLLMTREEAEFFMDENCSASFTNDQIDAVYALSGGCVSLLRIIAVSFDEMGGGAVDFEAKLAHAESRVSKYRLGCLSRMYDEAVIWYLMKMSFAPRFTAGMRKAMGLDDLGRDVIDSLKACGVIEESKTELGTWHSISAGFRDTIVGLRDQYLTDDERDEVCNALIKWYEDEEMYEEALELMIMQKYDGRFISLFTRNMEALLQRNDGSRILNWLGSMTETAATSNLATLLASAWGSFTAGLPEESLRWLRYVFAGYNYEHIATRDENPDYYDLWSIIRTVEACATSQMGDYAKGIELSLAAIDRLGGVNIVLADRTNLWLWVTLWHNLGESYIQVGEPQKGAEALSTSRMDSIIARRPILYHFCSYEIGMVRLYSGNIKGAERLLKETIRAGSVGVPAPSTWALGLVHLGMAKVRLLENRVDEAQAQYDTAKAIVSQSANVDGYLECLMFRCMLELSRGNMNHAQQAIREAYNEATSSRVPRGVAEDVLLCKLTIDVMIGDYLSARLVMRECDERISDDDKAHQAVFAAAKAYYYAATKDFSKALALVDEAIELARQLDYLFGETQYATLRVGILWSLGRKEEAADAVFNALTLSFGMAVSAVWRSYSAIQSVRVVLDKYLHSSDPLFANRRRNVNGLLDFAKECLMGIDAYAQTAPERGEWPTSLTPKELTVYEMIVDGKTRKKIADALGVSQNTVKTHVRSIYRKLGVHSNKELRERGLPKDEKAGD